MSCSAILLYSVCVCLTYLDSNELCKINSTSMWVSGSFCWCVHLRLWRAGDLFPDWVFRVLIFGRLGQKGRPFFPQHSGHHFNASLNTICNQMSWKKKSECGKMWAKQSRQLESIEMLAARTNFKTFYFLAFRMSLWNTIRFCFVFLFVYAATHIWWYALPIRLTIQNEIQFYDFSDLLPSFGNYILYETLRFVDSTDVFLRFSWISLLGWWCVPSQFIW